MNIPSLSYQDMMRLSIFDRDNQLNLSGDDLPNKPHGNSIPSLFGSISSRHGSLLHKSRLVSESDVFQSIDQSVAKLFQSDTNDILQKTELFSNKVLDSIDVEESESSLESLFPSPFEKISSTSPFLDSPAPLDTTSKRKNSGMNEY